MMKTKSNQFKIIDNVNVRKIQIISLLVNMEYHGLLKMFYPLKLKEK